MAVNPASASGSAGRLLAGPGVPGLRTLRSARFRLVVALTLATVAALVLGSVLLRQASDPNGQFAFDFAAYHAAALDLAAGRSPYDPQMLAGPIPSQGEVLYKYPPLLAQVLTPLAALPLNAAAAIWLVAQGLMILAGVWLAARAGGAAQSAETLAGVAVAAMFFLPCFDTLWKGNVSGVLALAVGVAIAGGAAGGFGAAAAALVKTTPVVLLLPAIAAGRGSWLGMAAWLPMVALSIVASPGAWHDFVRVLPNLVTGASVYATNVAPHSLVAFAWPAAPALVEAVRLAALGAGGAALLRAALLARRPGRWPAAVTLAVAALLLLPSATWYHYLAVVLPVAAFHWPRLPARGRVGLLAAGTAVSFGLVWLPLAAAGAAAMLVVSLWAGVGSRPDARPLPAAGAAT